MAGRGTANRNVNKLQFPPQPDVSEGRQWVDPNSVQPPFQPRNSDGVADLVNSAVNPSGFGVVM
jgi:hypothetical protein